MKHTKHTPGPWAATQFTGTYGGPDTWGVRLSNNTGITPMLEANARLIAAAPDLLNAAQLAVEYLGDDLNPKRIPALDALLLAIHKAVGGGE